MTTFNERERAFENLFVHDEEMRFRALARRNKAVAAWAASRMGLTSEAAGAYQAEILGLGLGDEGDEALVQRVTADLAQAGQAVPSTEVRAELTRRLAEAVAAEGSA